MKIVLLVLFFVALSGRHLFKDDKINFTVVLSSYESYEPLLKNDLFDTDEVLNIKLSGDVKELFNDRGDNMQFHKFDLSYKEEDTGEISVPLTIKTRGHFRRARENCVYPPLMLQFSKTEPVLSSVFKDHPKLKLVVPCQGDEYVVREWMVYRLYNLITTKSFKARLVSVQLDDKKKKKNASPFYGILLEEEQQMAKRNNSVVVYKKMMRPEQTEPEAFLKMAVFEYMIGNTDWSVQYQQNVKLLAKDSNAVPTTVAYDFDHAGLVNAPYAKPAEELEMSSVLQRRYRGYCIQDMEKFADVISYYNQLKKQVYNLYENCPLLDAKYIKATTKYFDEFYATINNSKELQKEFSYPCDKNGTGNVVIRGLGKN